MALKTKCGTCGSKYSPPPRAKDLEKQRKALLIKQEKLGAEMALTDRKILQIEAKLKKLNAI